MSDFYNFGDLGPIEYDSSYTPTDADVTIAYSEALRRFVATRRGSTQTGGKFDFGPLGVLEIDPSYTKDPDDLIPVYSRARRRLVLLKRGS